MNYLNFFVLLLLLAIAWQDFKFRAVYWWLFPLLLLTLAFCKSWITTTAHMLADFSMNLAFLGIQLILLTAYFSVKKGKLVNIFNGLFGFGDLLFLLCLATYFSLFNYITYYLASLFLVLVATVVFQRFFKSKSPKIPLAGEQALLFGLLLWVTSINGNLNLTSDHWMLVHFMN